MGLSNKIRDRKKRVINFINSLSDRYVESLGGYTPSINEGSDNKIVDLDAVQSIIDGNSFEKITFGKDMVNPYDSKAEVRIFFMTNKNKTIDDTMPNTYRIAIEEVHDRYSDEISYEVTYGFIGRTKVTDFNESPLKYNTKDATMTFDILASKCDSDVIYDSLVGVVKENLHNFDIMAYSMFTSNDLKHLRSRAVSTLAVGLHKRTGKFIYYFNPDFILREALEEYCNNGDMYRSLKDCYVYLLTFFIAHEMAHLVTNNSTHSIKNSFVDLDDTYASGGVDNVVMDGFINAKLKTVLSRLPNISNKAKGIGGVFPSNCITDIIHLRAQHNVGLKSFKSFDEMTEVVIASIDNVSKLFGEETEVKFYNETRKDSISPYVGADIFCNIYINGSFKKLRSSSHIFQKVINDIIRSITNGKIYWSKNGGITDEEKVSDKEILKDGTLVKVKGTSVVGIVKSHREIPKGKYIVQEVYSVNYTKIDKVDDTDLGDGKILHTPIYVDSGNFYAELDRKYILPIESSYGSWIEDTNKIDKTELSEEDLDDNDGSGMGEMDGSSSDSGSSGNSPKSISVGDIVWVAKKKRFGIVTSIVNGVFHVEDVKEEPCVVLDDSDNH